MTSSDRMRRSRSAASQGSQTFFERPDLIASSVAARRSAGRVGSASSPIITLIVKTQERFTDAGRVPATPVFFASNAICPIDQMPSW